MFFSSIKALDKKASACELLENSESLRDHWGGE